MIKKQVEAGHQVPLTDLRAVSSTIKPGFFRGLISRLGRVQEQLSSDVTDGLEDIRADDLGLSTVRLEGVPTVTQILEEQIVIQGLLNQHPNDLTPDNFTTAYKAARYRARLSDQKVEESALVAAQEQLAQFGCEAVQGSQMR